MDHASQFAAELYDETRHNDRDEKRHGVLGEREREQRGDRCRQRTFSQHVVDDDLQRPGCEGGQCDLSDRQRNDRDNAAAVGSQEREGPGDHRPLAPGECGLG